ncbi:MAG: YceI family protein [Bacteroidota bacterium]
MKDFVLLTIILIACSLQLDKKEINTDKSTITFVFESKDINGTIGDIRSNSKIDLENLENSSLQGSVAVTTLKTGNFLRDGHLMWEKYFNRKEHPRLTFKSEVITKKIDGTYSIIGDLTIKGTSKQEEFTAYIELNRLRVDGLINISDYSIEIDKEKDKNTVAITMNFRV